MKLKNITAREIFDSRGNPTVECELIFENIRMSKKESYMQLEKERSFHKLMNLHIINQYM